MTNATTKQEDGRDTTIAEIRRALKARSGVAWSVKGGRGTAWGWIRISAPPARCNDFGSMNADDADRLAQLFGLDRGHHQGVSVPASTAHYREYIERANGRPAEPTPAYWD